MGAFCGQRLFQPSGRRLSGAPHRWAAVVLKLLTLALWIAPAILLFVYLLWLSKGAPRNSRIAAPRRAHRAVSDGPEAAGQPVERAS